MSTVFEVDNKHPETGTFDQILKWLADTKGVLVAYSGGVDSTLLASLAYEALGSRMIAVNAYSEIYSDAETSEAQKIAEKVGFPFLAVRSHELKNPKFAENSPLRCYHCKQELFDRLFVLAREHGMDTVIDGQNIDDTKDFRPGIKAGRERGIISPFINFGVTKDDIKREAKRRQLPNWDKPPHPCLSTRFPYGAKITAAALSTVDSAEEFLKGLGFKTFRIRIHDEIARLEVGSEEFTILSDPDVRRHVTAALKSKGFKYVTLDLTEFKSGSMNTALKEKNA